MAQEEHCLVDAAQAEKRVMTIDGFPHRSLRLRLPARPQPGMRDLFFCGQAP